VEKSDTRKPTMYSRRQRSTRNASAAANPNVGTTARTTRGRTNKAKHPRRGGGNPDTARVRASIERQPVVPWIRVMRPPALHLRRTFLVEKWVRPSDLTSAERKVYDEQQKEKEEGKQRQLIWQQRRREEEEKQKERERQQQEQQQRQQKEQQEKDRLLVTAAGEAATAPGQDGENGKTKEPKTEEGKGDTTNPGVKPGDGAPSVTVPTEAAVTTMASAIPAAVQNETGDSAMTQAAPGVTGGSEDAPTPTPALPTPTTQAVPDQRTQPLVQQNEETSSSIPPMPKAAPAAAAHFGIPELQQPRSSQKNESDSTDGHNENPSKPINDSSLPTPISTEVQQQQTDAVITSPSTEPLTKKQRIE